MKRACVLRAMDDKLSKIKKILTGALKRCKTIGNYCVSAFLVLRAVSKMKKHLTIIREPFKPLWKPYVSAMRPS